MLHEFAYGIEKAPREGWPRLYCDSKDHDNNLFWESFHAFTLGQPCRIEYLNIDCRAIKEGCIPTFKDAMKVLGLSVKRLTLGMLAFKEEEEDIVTDALQFIKNVFSSLTEIQIADCYFPEMDWFLEEPWQSSKYLKRATFVSCTLSLPSIFRFISYACLLESIRLDPCDVFHGSTRKVQVFWRLRKGKYRKIRGRNLSSEIFLWKGLIQPFNNHGITRITLQDSKDSNGCPLLTIQEDPPFLWPFKGPQPIGRRFVAHFRG
jgi:hypothetical protein